MSYCGVCFVLFFVLGYIAFAMELPMWIFMLSILVAMVFEFVALQQFDKMRERVNKLEKELEKRKDGADDDE